MRHEIQWLVLLLALTVGCSQPAPADPNRRAVLEYLNATYKDSKFEPKSWGAPMPLEGAKVLPIGILKGLPVSDPPANGTGIRVKYDHITPLGVKRVADEVFFIVDGKVDYDVPAKCFVPAGQSKPLAK